MKPTKTQNQESSNSTNVEQNLNIHLIPDVFSSIAELEKQNPELAKKAIELIEFDLKKSYEERENIILLEKQEQEIRKEEIPFIRKYAFKGQLFAFFTGLAGLITAGYFGNLGMEKAAIASMSITIGVLALNFITSKKNNMH